jgi:hypothetical protein
MIKLTKNQFIEFLHYHEHQFLGRSFSYTTDEELAKWLSQLNADKPWRTVERANTNSLQFSDGSRLYLDQKGEHWYGASIICNMLILQMCIITPSIDPTEHKFGKILYYRVKI